MRLTRALISALTAVALLTMPGCGAVSALSGASKPLDSYTLAPLPRKPGQTGGRLHLVVELPAAAGALANDRILLKPNRLQAEYLPKGGWSEPAPVLVQTLLVNSLQNVGGFARVGRDGAGLMPDYTLVSDISDFQVEAGTPFTVRIGLNLTLIRESDRSIQSTRRFEQTAASAGDTAADLVPAFDTAMQAVLTETTKWISQQVR